MTHTKHVRQRYNAIVLCASDCWAKYNIHHHHHHQPSHNRMEGILHYVLLCGMKEQNALVFVQKLKHRKNNEKKIKVKNASVNSFSQYTPYTATCQTTTKWKTKRMKKKEKNHRIIVMSTKDSWFDDRNRWRHQRIIFQSFDFSENCWRREARLWCEWFFALTSHISGKQNKPICPNTQIENFIRKEHSY